MYTTREKKKSQATNEEKAAINFYNALLKIKDKQLSEIDLKMLQKISLLLVSHDFKNIVPETLELLCHLQFIIVGLLEKFYDKVINSYWIYECIVENSLAFLSNLSKKITIDLPQTTLVQLSQTLYPIVELLISPETPKSIIKNLDENYKSIKNLLERSGIDLLTELTRLDVKPKKPQFTLFNNLQSINFAQAVEHYKSIKPAAFNFDIISVFAQIFAQKHMRDLERQWIDLLFNLYYGNSKWESALEELFLSGLKESSRSSLQSLGVFLSATIKPNILFTNEKIGKILSFFDKCLANCIKDPQLQLFDYEDIKTIVKNFEFFFQKLKEDQIKLLFDVSHKCWVQIMLICQSVRGQGNEDIIEENLKKPLIKIVDVLIEMSETKKINNNAEILSDLNLINKNPYTKWLTQKSVILLGDTMCQSKDFFDQLIQNLESAYSNVSLVSLCLTLRSKYINQRLTEERSTVLLQVLQNLSDSSSTDFLCLLILLNILPEASVAAYIEEKNRLICFSGKMENLLLRFIFYLYKIDKKMLINLYSNNIENEFMCKYVTFVDGSLALVSEILIDKTLKVDPNFIAEYKEKLIHVEELVSIQKYFTQFNSLLQIKLGVILQELINCIDKQCYRNQELLQINELLLIHSKYREMPVQNLMEYCRILKGWENQDNAIFINVFKKLLLYRSISLCIETILNNISKGHNIDLCNQIITQIFNQIAIDNFFFENSIDTMGMTATCSQNNELKRIFLGVKELKVKKFENPVTNNQFCYNFWIQLGHNIKAIYKKVILKKNLYKIFSGQCANIFKKI